MEMFARGWQEAMQDEFSKPYYDTLTGFVRQEYEKTRVFPAFDDIYNAFSLTPPEIVKVVILGQDPYHNEGEAHGLAFSVLPDKKKIPPSLRNIYKELHDDLGCDIPAHGSLTAWAKQGVLLLNSVLTVRALVAGSHRGKGWEEFTDAVIKFINNEDRPLVFLLWGRDAVNKKPLLTNPAHLVLESSHPSPFSAYNGFFGCRHFSKANEFLTANGIDAIDWQIK
ncbi:MAG: uracil-DNA glycosylase [Lachnospiraceae bacterium]|jgi:uracil-DNA glycosylase|nr:uracil-DNA glycosylase [Lachnospiraceae bacterium]